MEGVRSTKAIWLLLAATLFLRALVPAGWMPDTASGSDVIVAKMCNSSMVVTIPLGRDPAPGDSTAHQSETCLFAGFAGDAPLVPADLALVAAPPVEQQPVAILAALLLQRTAFLLPPGRGPPVAA